MTENSPTPAPTPRVRVTTLYSRETAAILRRILRQAFPACRFSVRTGRGSGVSAVDVRWTDGPTRRAVEAIAHQFKAGSFDGMTDSYDYKRGTDRYLVVDGVTYEVGCQYVSCERTLSPAFRLRIAQAISARWGDLPVPTLDTWGCAPREADAHAQARTGRTWAQLIWEAAEDRTKAAPLRREVPA
jgi:hypothetical protein